MHVPAARLPLAVRLWHGFTALLFSILAITGIKLHFAPPLLLHFGYALATQLHHACGIALAIIYVLYCVFVCVTGYWRQYIPVFRGLPKRLRAQLRAYTNDLGRRSKHTNPNDDNPEQRFNTLQQLVYGIVFFCLLPLLIVSGLAYLYYPEISPDSVLGFAGLWPLALVHYVLGIGGIMYLVTHIYMAVSDARTGARFKRMTTGRVTPNPSDKHARERPRR